MNRQRLLVVVAFLVGVVAGAVACQETPDASADSRISDFLQVGQWYSAAGSDGDPYYFQVSRIINDSWILAQTEYGDVWVNVNQLVAIEKQ